MDNHRGAPATGVESRDDVPTAGTPEMRRARVGESDTIAELYWRIREQTLEDGSIPEGIHSLDEHRSWVRDRLFGELEVWVAEVDGELVGFMVLGRPDW